APIDVTLEPDQREITVDKNEDLKVRCSAKCFPKCDVTWGKDFQVLGSNDLINLTETVFGKDLKIVNISSSYEGFYVCLVNNIHGEAKTGFTLSVRESISVKVVIGFVIVIAAIVIVMVFVIVFVIIVIVYKKYLNKKKKNDQHIRCLVEDSIYDTIDESLIGTSRNDEPRTSRDHISRNDVPGTSRDNNSRNSIQNM
ncbi:hypothetical protein LOTGIDRAFT_176868, partial [Lottia gigantea]